jgi:ribosomal protein L11 methyltransferase
MRWIEAKVFFQAPAPGWAAECIAQIFLDLGLPGVAIEDPDEPAPEPWAEPPTLRPQGHAVSGYFADHPGWRRQALALEKALDNLAGDTGIVYRIDYNRLNDQDWAESWKAHFHPLAISDRMTVKPTWRPYAAKPGEMVIEIDPGMAFGTGTHPTTHLCLNLMEAWVKPGQQVLDVGTGSGILLIAAAKLGAAMVFGVDKDPAAVAVARDNLRLNHVPDSTFGLAAGNLIQAVKGRFDLVAANILTEVIVRLLDDLARVLTPQARFICSGMIRRNTHRVEKGLRRLGLAILERREKDQWVALVAGHR